MIMRAKYPAILVLLAVIIAGGCDQDVRMPLIKGERAIASRPSHAAGEGLCIHGACFEIELMHTDEEKARGLMFRKGLDEGRGMFFVFDQEDIYPFWMKNMAFPIDIIWFDRELRAVHIEANVPACSTDPCPVYTPGARAMYVLEIPAGAALKHGIVLGDLATR